MKSVLVITGAGISAASGIPTYRGEGGQYLRVTKFEDGDLWAHANQTRGVMRDAAPNEAHRLLIEIESISDRFLIATQNVDGLHTAAGSKNVTELHGNIWQVAIPKQLDYTEDPDFEIDQRMLHHPVHRDEVLQRWSMENNREVWENRDIPYIPAHSHERPNIVFFGEPYGNRLLWVNDFIKQGVDTILIVGCSGAVDIVSKLIRDAKEVAPNCRAVSINPEPHTIEEIDEDLQMTAVDGLKQFLDTNEGDK